MDQICINSPENIIALVSMVIAGVSTVVNFVPSPDEAKGPMKVISRVLHFLALDVVTAKK